MTSATLRQYRLGFAVTAMLLLAIAVTLPFSVASIVDHVLGPATGKVFPLMKHPRTSLAPTFSRLHAAVISLDETRLSATLRVSGHHTCSDCAWTDRVLFVSLAPDDAEAEGLPPSTNVTLPASIRGRVEADRASPPGLPHSLSVRSVRHDRGGRAAARLPRRADRDAVARGDPRHLSLSLQELLPSLLMSRARARRRGSSPLPRGSRALRRRLPCLVRAAPTPPGAGRPARAADRVGRRVLGPLAAARRPHRQLGRGGRWGSGAFARSSPRATSST